MRKVIKVGSSSLFNGGPKTEVFDSIAGQVAQLRDSGHDVAVVSSAAIAFGRKRLGMPKGVFEDIHTKQALASLGQPFLMAQWSRAFERHGLNVGQALLTRQELTIGEYDAVPMIKGTFNRLFDLGIVPIVNENDTVASEEIKFGDNDKLAASVARIIGANTLHLLGTTDALYRDFPTNIDAIREAPMSEMGVFEGLAFDSSDPQASGGMITKLEAAKIFVGYERDMYIGPALLPNAVSQTEQGLVGTRFYQD